MKNHSGFPAFLAVLLCLALFSLPSDAARSGIGYPRVMEGPMVGHVTADTIHIWVRLAGEFQAQVEFSSSQDFTGSRKTEVLRPSKERDDHTAVLSMTGLEPSTVYHYRILINGQKDPYLGAFTAQTAPDGPARFKVAFGSCPRFQRDPVQPIWLGLAQIKPDLFFWTGDNIYGDTLLTEILAEEYRKQLSVPNLRPFLASVPQLAVWDDHDFGLNDHDRTNPVKDGALAVFRQYWANPAYGLPGTPGVFFQYAYGGVDFFFLDCRYHRDPNTEPDGPGKTFLGAGQLAWLKEGLTRSTAPFKVLVSGSGWTNAKGAGGDSWASCLHERDALFDFIRDNSVAGVLLISGDTHTGEFNAIPWSEKGGYDYYDLVSSPLAQKASSGWRNRFPELRVRTPYEDVNAGLMEFDLTASPPTVSLNLVDVDGNPVWTPVTLTTDDLQNGAATAKSKSGL